MRKHAYARHASHRRRATGPLLGLAAIVTVVPLVAAPAAGAVAIPLPDGNNVRTLSPVTGGYINGTLQGALCQAPRVCTPIDYASFFSFNGVEQLELVLKDPSLPSDTVVFGYSNGAQVATTWIAQHAGDPNAPSPDKVKFVLIGNSVRKYGGSDKEFGISQPSQYQIVDVSRQYDPVSDLPDNIFNLLAVANALFAAQANHDYTGVDVNSPDNVVWKEGNITYVLVPTKNLPLLAPLRALGLTALADGLNAFLKPIVDAGYNRSYIPDGTPNRELLDGTAPVTPATTAVTEKPTVRAKSLLATASVSAAEPHAAGTLADASSPETAPTETKAPLTAYPAPTAGLDTGSKKVDSTPQADTTPTKTRSTSESDAGDKKTDPPSSGTSSNPPKHAASDDGAGSSRATTGLATSTQSSNGKKDDAADNSADKGIKTATKPTSATKKDDDGSGGSVKASAGAGKSTSGGGDSGGKD